MAMKCDRCIHNRVCKDKPPESYPQFMIDIMTDKCEHYINNTGVQPVKHGRWVWESNYRDYDGEEEVLISVSKVAHISGTTKAFIDPTDIYLLLRKDGTTVATVNTRQAWDILSSEFLEISRKYGVDMRIYGFERAMEFNREVIIEKGKIIKDDVIEFDDYDWECIMPNLGG